MHSSLAECGANGPQKGQEAFCNFKLNQSESTWKDVLCIPSALARSCAQRKSMHRKTASEVCRVHSRLLHCSRPTDEVERNSTCGGFRVCHASCQVAYSPSVRSSSTLCSSLHPKNCFPTDRITWDPCWLTPGWRRRPQARGWEEREGVPFPCTIQSGQCFLQCPLLLPLLLGSQGSSSH